MNVRVSTNRNYLAQLKVQLQKSRDCLKAEMVYLEDLIKIFSHLRTKYHMHCLLSSRMQPFPACFTN